MPAQAVSRGSVITAERIGKDYAYYKKEPGLRGSLRNLFHRLWMVGNSREYVKLGIDARECAALKIGVNQLVRGRAAGFIDGDNFATIES